MTDATATTAATTLETHFVGRTSIVHIPDGRAFSGTFLCVDSGQNIILGNAEEMRLTVEGRTSSRNVGMIMIPGEYVVRVEVQEEGSGTQGSLAQAAGGWPDDDSMYT